MGQDRQEMKYVKFPVDKNGKVKLITWAASLGGVALGLSLYTFAGFTLIPSLVFILPAAYAFCDSAHSLAITESGVEVHRPFDKLKIPFAEITNVTFINTLDLSWCLWGSRGIFGYNGHYRTRSLGRFKVYAGIPKDVIFIETKRGKKFMLSCRDSWQAYNLIKNHLEVGAEDCNKV